MSDTTFVAPDEGAVDRASAVAHAVGVDRPVVWARKRRTPAGSSISGWSAHRAVVVEAILDTGDTLVSCCRQLREAGVRRIGVIATHAPFTADRWRVLLAGGVPETWITTACSRAAARRRHRSWGSRRCWRRCWQ